MSARGHSPQVGEWAYSYSMAKVEVCRLCERRRTLCGSHIVPKFAIKWLKKVSRTPLRGAANPNIRIQDAFKVPFLCRDCEDRLEEWETPFAANLFHPLQEQQPDTKALLPYDTWALKFAVSASWRVLKFHSEETRFAELPRSVVSAASNALDTWRRFMLGMCAEIAEFEQHMLYMSPVTELVPGISSRINQYFVRTVDEDLPRGKDTLLVYTKLGKIAIFGVVPAPKTVDGWGTKLLVNGGAFSPSSWNSMNRDALLYLSSKADDLPDLFAQLSPRQRARIAKSRNFNEHSVKEDLRQAILHDQRISRRR